MKQRWTISVGIAFIAILAHIETIGYWFVTSDILTLTVSSRAATIDGVTEVFTQPLMAGTSFTKNALFYRPLMSFSYTLDYALWGLDPTGYHLTNLVLHGVAVALTTLVVTAITDLESGSLTGLLVAAHPMTAEVVPAASRRDSVLMSIFLLTALLMLIRGRQRASRRLLAGSVAAYALALLSKELSILFLGLAFVWVVFDELDGEDSISQDIVPAVRTALRHLIPFILVSVAYVGVRVAVLGGLGGYDQSRPLTLDRVFEIVTKYIMSIAYPQDIISALIGVVGLDPLLTLGGLLGVFALVMCGLAVRRPHYTGALALAIVAGGVGSLPFVAILLDRFGVEIVIDYYTPQPVALGGLFVAGLAVGALIALAAFSQRRFAGTNWRSFAFFAIWFMSPIPLFLLSGAYTVRNGYFFLIPAMGLVAFMLTTAIRSIDLDVRELDTNVALTVITIVFVLSLLVTSPLAHEYDGWHTSGETNRATLTALKEARVDAPNDGTVQISKMPGNVRTHKQAFPQVHSLSYAQEFTVESWLRLHDSDSQVTVRISKFFMLPRTPTGATAATGRKNGTTRVDIRYTDR